MNQPLRRLATVVIVMFLALMGAATWVQFVSRPTTLNADPRNVRTLYREFGNARGPIVVDGEADRASRSRSTTRSTTSATYTDGELYSAVTGFYSIVNGKHAARVRGERPAHGPQRPAVLQPRPRPAHGPPARGRRGRDDDQRRRAAGRVRRRSATRQGAVVAHRAVHRAILALVSTPGFDPNELASHSSKKAVDAAYAKLASAEGNPLRSNATRETYPPGSTFKLVTAAAALESGRVRRVDRAARARRASTSRRPPRPSATSAAAAAARPDHAGRRAARLLQHRVRAARHGPRRRRAARAGRALRVRRRRPDHPDGHLDEPCSPTTRTRRRPPSRRSASSTCRRRRCRWRWSSAAIANGGRLMTPYVVDRVRAGRPAAWSPRPSRRSTRPPSRPARPRPRSAT